VTPVTPKPAASVLLVRSGSGSPAEVYMIRRQQSMRFLGGYYAFPGGKVEVGEEPRQTAERETQEEIGLDLRSSARYLGWLTEITGARLPVRVSCFVYGMLEMDVKTEVSGEVHDLFWVGLDELLATERHVLAQVRFGGKLQDVPAIRLPQPGKPVLWGITYRLVKHFLELLPAI